MKMHALDMMNTCKTVSIFMQGCWRGHIGQITQNHYTLDTSLVQTVNSLVQPGGGGATSGH